MVRLLLVDDHPIFRKGLAALISDSIRACEIFEAVDGNEAIRMLSENMLDIAVLDPAHPLDQPQQRRQ